MTRHFKPRKTARAQLLGLLQRYRESTETLPEKINNWRPWV